MCLHPESVTDDSIALAALYSVFIDPQPDKTTDPIEIEKIIRDGL